MLVLISTILDSAIVLLGVVFLFFWQNADICFSCNQKTNNLYSKADILLNFLYPYAVYSLCTEWRQPCESHGKVRTCVI